MRGPLDANTKVINNVVFTAFAMTNNTVQWRNEKYRLDIKRSSFADEWQLWTGCALLGVAGEIDELPVPEPPVIDRLAEVIDNT